MNFYAQLALSAFAVYLFSGGWRYVRVVLYTLPRDLTGLIRLIKTYWYLYRIRRRNATVPQLFMENCARNPNKVMFYYEDQEWTMKRVDELSNKIANAFLESGYQPGQEVAIFMESRPEFVATWLGMAKAGIVSAFINTNQRLDTLIHSVTVVNCRALIFGSELDQHVAAVYDQLLTKVPSLEFYRYKDNCNTITNADKQKQQNTTTTNTNTNTTSSTTTTSTSTTTNAQLESFQLESNVKSLDTILEESSSSEPLNLKLGSFSDRLFYIYTSGTTGLPKAAIIKHSRFMFVGAGLRNLLCLNEERLYTSIPLYHLAGGIMGVSQCLLFNSSMIIKRRFSASQFWPDCIKYKATSAQYIGELCRYLLSQPKRDCDTKHTVKVMFGNGLRPQLWKEFYDRFKLKKIGEFYGSTEGNANIVNFDNTPGACGFVSRILPIVYPVTLIKCDPLTGVPERDSRGVCVRCGPGETGEFVGKILEGDPVRSFDGYANQDATKRKIVRDVFWKGDMAFSSGDLLEMDEYGYVYFKDRTGDTYRWKGENVSTMEIESLASDLLDQRDCVVYGVEVPNCEGKAGMISIAAANESEINLNEFITKLRKNLADYAMPVFIRLVPQIEATGTFKLPKVSLQREGFNINKLDDPIYLVDLKKNDCVRLTADLYDQLQSGKIKM